MGGVQSKLKTLAVGLKALLQISKQFDDILKRASQPPGLPVPNPSKSYWLEDPPFPELVGIQSPELPRHTDIVIIGSGITGAAVARSILLESARNKHSSGGGGDEGLKVVVLEARTLCSGATGRNGGHMKSSPHELFARLRESGIEPDRAAAITRFQLAHVKVLTELCKAEGWDLAECREVETADLYLNAEDRDKAFEEVRELRKWIPELEIEMYDATEAQKRFEVNKFVVGAISYGAGALWPFRFVSSVWRDLLDKFHSSLSIETGTGVTDIQAESSDKSSPYTVETTRGSIRCNHIVHATNGFATQFIPGLRGKMSGFQAHMSAQRPGKQFPDYDGARSWSVVYGKAYDYVTQRPTIDGIPGDIMLGGGFDRGRDQGMDVFGRWDDSAERIDALTLNHITNIFPTVFSPHWGNDREGGRVKNAWTGIVCITGDFLPFVGRLDPKLTKRRPMGTSRFAKTSSGEWVAAGFCGDGMVWSWLSGTALGSKIVGSEQEDRPAFPGRPAGRTIDWFPRELEPTLRRVKKADLSNLAGLLL